VAPLSQPADGPTDGLLGCRGIDAVGSDRGGDGWQQKAHQNDWRKPTDGRNQRGESSTPHRGPDVRRHDDLDDCRSYDGGPHHGRAHDNAAANNPTDTTTDSSSGHTGADSDPAVDCSTGRDRLLPPADEWREVL
jgi:hypothetical protein